MEGFDYVIKRLPPARICFGSSLKRQTLPAQSKFQNSLMRRVNHECFDAPIFNPDDQPACHCPALAPNGYGPLASRSPRFAYASGRLSKRKRLGHHSDTSHGTLSGSFASQKSHGYHARCMRPREEKSTAASVAVQCWQPFGRSMHEPDRSSTTPGPGSYTQHLRTVRITGSFGGRRVLTQAVRNVCAPQFMVQCAICRRRPNGLYWQQKPGARRTAGSGTGERAMCRHCMKAAREQLMYERSRVRRQRLENDLDAYERARYCDFMHEHGGTTAHVHLMTKRELMDKFRRETYLAMFHM